MLDFLNPANFDFQEYDRLMMEQIAGVARKSMKRLWREQCDRYNINPVTMALNLTGGLNAAGNPYRGTSQVIWGDCPWDTMKKDPGYGTTFEDDFVLSSSAIASNTGAVGGWSTYASTGATILDGAVEGGVIKIGSDGDNEGVALISQSGSFRFVTTSTLTYNQKMWFEARWARSSITTAIADHFVGLMKTTLSSGLPATAQPITTTDDTLMTAGSFFGFHSNSSSGTRGGPTEIAAAFELTSGTINYPTNCTTLMASSGNAVLTAAAMVKTGWVFDPFTAPFKRITSATARQTAGQVVRAMLRFFINGLEVPTFLSSADIANATATQAFPTDFMTPVFAIMNTAGTATNTLNCDWVRVAQRANS